MNNHKNTPESTEKSPGLVPLLRFPEFQGIWSAGQLGDEDISIFVKDRAEVNKLSLDTYVSTENLLPDFLGLVKASRLPPSGSFTQYKKGDILVSNIRPYLKKIWFANQSGAASNDVIVIRAKEEKLSKELLAFLLQNDVFVNYVMKDAKGVKMPRGDVSSMKQFPIFYPKNIKEQQKITDCLSSLDELITVENQKLDTLKDHKKGLMQQLFPAEGQTTPKYRFPDFINSDEWKEITFIETADKEVKWSFIGGPFGSNLKSSDYVEKGIQVIQLQNIGDGIFSSNYQIYTSEEKANELLSNNIYSGDIILSKMGDPVGRACIIPGVNTRYVMCSDGIRLAVDEKTYDKYFIYSLINSTPFRSLIERTATGSTRKRIGLDQLKNLKMRVPIELKEQQKIADCLSSIDDLITAQTQKIESLKDHKKGSIQQLFPSCEASE